MTLFRLADLAPCITVPVYLTCHCGAETVNCGDKSLTNAPPLGASPRRLKPVASRRPARHPQHKGPCPSAYGLTPKRWPPEGAKQYPQAAEAVPASLSV